MFEIIGYVLLGLFLLLVPGFFFSLVLYPKSGDMDFWTRVGVSLGLGTLLLIYVGFFIAKPEMRMLQLAPFVGMTVGACAVLAILAYIRGGAEVVLTYARAVIRTFRRPEAARQRPDEEVPPPAEEPRKKNP
jgi:uncharacterized membrane protein